MRAPCYLASLFCFGVGCAVVVVRPPEADAAPTNASAGTRLPPLPPPPIAYFRQLLALRPADLDKTLAGIAGPIRTNLQAKLREYAALTADEREARLQATELQWYLGPLMRTAPTNRLAQLALIPDEYRTTVKECLEQWDALPPDAQKDFLRILSASASEREDAWRGLSPEQREKLEKQLASWSSLPFNQRRRMYDNFQRYFQLPPREKQRTLDTLSEPERQEMEKTLRAFEKLPPAQRLVCIRSFQKFAEMTPEERAQFLKNAELWKKMSPGDRQTWRMLVTRLPPLPPLPPGLGEPPLPPGFQRQKSGSAMPLLPTAPVHLTNASE